MGNVDLYNLEKISDYTAVGLHVFEHWWCLSTYFTVILIALPEALMGSMMALPTVLDVSHLRHLPIVEPYTCHLKKKH